MKKISDSVLLERTFIAAKNEQNATLVLLEYLLEVDERKAYLILGFTSLFDFVMRGLKYSETQTTERLSAMRLLRQVPEVKTHMASGELNLTNAAQIQRFIYAEKKTEPQAIINECLGHSKREVAKILDAYSSDETKSRFKERMKETENDKIEIRFTMDKEIVDRLKELVRYESIEELFNKAAKALIQEQEKKLEKDSALPAKLAPTNPNSRHIPKRIKQQIYQRSNGQCEFEHHGKRCTSKHHLEVDHIQPFALGGQTTPENLRHLCGAVEILPNFSESLIYARSTEQCPALI